jgi:nitrite reductase/ring-hydroxylating ferredoxin subunit
MASLLDFGRKEEWVVAFPKSRIDPGEVKPIRVAGLDLLVVATRDGKRIYCIANSCSHLGTPLETGMMERRKTDRPTEDGCEDCIVCPLHKTAFALETGEVNGEWCPYPPLLGAMMGAVKTKSSVAVFDIRTRGKNIEIKLNSRLDDENKAKQRDSEIKEGA